MNEPPIKGMTVKIYGYDDPLLCGAFICCCQATIEQEGMIEAFEKETGCKPTMRRSGIAAMVDKACGFDPLADFAGKWGDWVAKNFWGLDGETDPDELAAMFADGKELEKAMLP